MWMSWQTVFCCKNCRLWNRNVTRNWSIRARQINQLELTCPATARLPVPGTLSVPSNRPSASCRASWGSPLRRSFICTRATTHTSFHWPMSASIAAGSAAWRVAMIEPATSSAPATQKCSTFWRATTMWSSRWDSTRRAGKTVAFFPQTDNLLMSTVTRSSLAPSIALQRSGRSAVANACAPCTVTQLRWWPPSFIRCTTSLWSLPPLTAKRASSTQRRHTSCSCSSNTERRW